MAKQKSCVCISILYGCKTLQAQVLRLMNTWIGKSENHSCFVLTYRRLCSLSVYFFCVCILHFCSDNGFVCEADLTGFSSTKYCIIPACPNSLKTMITSTVLRLCSLWIDMTMVWQIQARQHGLPYHCNINTQTTQPLHNHCFQAIGTYRNCDKLGQECIYKCEQ